MNKADRIKRMKTPEIDPKYEGRVPPGQVVTERFPILHEGDVPEYNLEEWTLRVFGLVDKEVTLSYQEILDMPQTTVKCDIHCVTRWTRLDNEFTGVLFTDFLKAIGVELKSKYIMLHGDNDYTSNIEVEDLLRDDILLAHSFKGEPFKEERFSGEDLGIPEDEWVHKDYD